MSKILCFAVGFAGNSNNQPRKSVKREEIKRQILGSYNQCCRHYIACSIDCSFVFAINKIVFQ